MTQIKRSAIVPYTPNEMYELVAAVDDYPRFLPWCESTRVLEREPDAVTASLTLNKGGLRKSFTTRNRLQQDKSIEMRLLDGPFRHLEGYWVFEPAGESGCRVRLDMEFEFANRLLSMAVGPVFTQVANSLVDAFRDRAEAIYGHRS